MRTLIKTLSLAIIICAFYLPAQATHTVGGSMTYTYGGDVVISGVTKHKYTITLQVYADCIHGQPEAIMQDNPAYIAIYNGAGTLLVADSVIFTSYLSVPDYSISPCGTTGVTVCVIKKTFVKDIYLAPDPSGYTVSYQRCCRNNALTNIMSPGSTGVTYSCTIPGGTITNTSAVFTGETPTDIAANYAVSFPVTATDADGDSLSYEFCSAVAGASDANIKPWPPLAPPFDDVVYVSSFSASTPLHGSVPFTVNPVTGVVSGTADVTGVYQIAICCKEWRAGVLINTVRREFEIVVSPSAVDYAPNAGPDVVLVAGTSYSFHATGADSYTWTPGTYLDTTTTATPTGVFPDPGTYTYTLHGTTTMGCAGDDVLTVTVLEASAFVVPNAFSPNGDDKNDVLAPFPVGIVKLNRFKIYNRTGNLVYSGGPGDDGWDGNYRGKRQDMGVFFWQLEYTDNKGKQKLTSGNVTLVR